MRTRRRATTAEPEAISPEAARAERDRVLGALRVDEDELRARAESCGLDAREMAALDELDAIDHLLSA